MKRSLQLTAAAAAGLGAFVVASPAFAQYSSGSGDAGTGAAVAFIWCCWGILMLLGLAFWVINIWMFVDALQRQEWEFPGTTSKTTWLVLLGVGFFIGFGWIVAIVYYFAVFKKLKRGTTAPPAGYMPGQGPQGYAPQPPAQQGYAPPPPPPAGPQGYAPPPPPPAPGPQGYAPPPPPPAPQPPAPAPEQPAPQPPAEPPAPAAPQAPPAPPAPGTPPEPPAPPAPPTEGE